MSFTVKFAALMLACGVGMLNTTANAGQPVAETPVATWDEETEQDEPKSIYDFKVESIDGETVDLSKYKGKTVLLINVASRCGYTKQYTDMQDVYTKYKDKGLVVLGFPCNQFGKQEPGDEKEIKEFCTEKFGVSFPMFSKVEVNGDQQAPLYKYLTSLDTKPKASGDISWNFEKFLIGPDGKVIGRYASKVNPSSKQMLKVIEASLPEQEEDESEDDK